ncbi:hypothetical protein [Shimazuella kribbensis]|uniref:hypothetical protein n=1 Tax=Shimazuella kribbensis TaxID=139808 RepID=UPI0003F5E0E7|nr:hypothetical protein [Shimazuella kribbensis]
MLKDAIAIVGVAIIAMVVIAFVGAVSFLLRCMIEDFIYEWKRALRSKEWAKMGMLAFFGVLFTLILVMLFLVIALGVQSVI